MPARGAAPGTRIAAGGPLVHGAGLLAAIVLHALLICALVWHEARPPLPPSVLIVEFKGVVAPRQVIQKEAQKASDETRPVAQPKPAPASRPDAPRLITARATPGNKPAPHAPQAVPDPAPVPPVPILPEPASAAPPQEQQDAQTVRTDPETEIERLRNYVRALSKRVQTRLIYPDEGRQAAMQGVAVVSFTILANGNIQQDTLKIVATSGQPALDASALQTLRASVPFDPPPRQMTIRISVVFGPRP